MGTSSRRKSSSISDRLFREPYRFSFFQATRLLQGLVRKWQNPGVSNPVGRDIVPENESVRFSSLLSLRFASSEVAKIHKHERIVKSDKQDIAEIQISFFGLTGQSSVLPIYFTELQLQRLRGKDASLRDFLDIFNHRATSFFYRAWEKYRLPFSYERQHLHNNKNADPITKAIESLLGIGEATTQKQMLVEPEDILYYAGLFASQRRSACGLEASLTEYMKIPITVNQFSGEWMSLSEDDRLQLPQHPLGGKNNSLGVDTVIGDQVYTVEGKFEIVIGPLNKSEFENLMPDSERMKALKRFTQMYVGCAQHYDVKYQLKEDAVSKWVLGESVVDEQLGKSRRLGWDTWLLSGNRVDAQRELTVSCSDSL